MIHSDEKDYYADHAVMTLDINGQRVQVKNITDVVITVVREYKELKVYGNRGPEYCPISSSVKGSFTVHENHEVWRKIADYNKAFPSVSITLIPGDASPQQKVTLSEMLFTTIPFIFLTSSEEVTFVASQCKFEL